MKTTTKKAGKKPTAAQKRKALTKGLPKFERNPAEESEGKPGRPSTMTTELANKAIELYALGSPKTLIGPQLKTPAHPEGLGRDIVTQWEDQHADFRAALKKAKGMRLDSHLGHVVAARPKNWTAAAWLLEREDPERYSMKAILFKLLGRDPDDPPPTPIAGRELTQTEREKLLERARALRDADAVQLKKRRG